MFKNYLLVALRNMRRFKGYTFINIFGLSVGIACCILILLFVRNELDYDRFNVKADRIFRIGLRAALNNNRMDGVVTCAPMAQTLVAEVPEVEAATRVWNAGYPVFRYEDKVFSEERQFFVDSTFFDVFTVEFLAGDPKTALNKPNMIVLTESMARKYFGDEDPMGKLINSDNRRDYLVTGVVKDVPANSHFHYDFLTSLLSYPRVINDNNWISNNYYTYIVLKDPQSAEVVEEKINQITRRNAEPIIQAALGLSWDHLMETGAEYYYYMQKMTDIHLKSQKEFEIEPNGNIGIVYIFSLIAIGIFVVACINFINLATARSAIRAKEVAIRKTIGSDKRQLIQQFMTETLLLSAIAVIIALGLVQLFLPVFNHLAGKSIQFTFWNNVYMIPFLLACILICGITAGIYPSFYMAAFDPVIVLKGEAVGFKRKSFLRSLLVVIQFVISVILIISTIIIFRQMQFTQRKDLGFDRENVVIVEKTDDLGNRLNTFKSELLENPNIVSATNTNNLMGFNFGNSVYQIAGESGEETHLFWTLRVDEDFARVFNIKVTNGRFFEKDRLADSNSVVLNESAAREMGITDPIGKQIIFPDPSSPRFTIVGVVRDFHFQSLQHPIRPMVLHKFNSQGFGRYLSVRVADMNTPTTLKYIEDSWRKSALNQAFEYEFFSDHFANVYLTERKSADILLIFSIIAIIIACLGLFGLAAFTTERRTKEIGIRKTLGSSVPGIIGILLETLTKWVIVANLIAWPVAWFIMHKWLQNFVYRTNLQIWIFILAGVVTLITAFLTVSYQSIKAAVSNPVKALRYE